MVVVVVVGGGYSREKQCDSLLPRSRNTGSVYLYLLTLLADPGTRPASSNTAAEFLHRRKKLVAEGKN